MYEHDADAWSTPGGSIDIDEIPEDAARREVFEETGLTVRLDGILTVLGGPEFHAHYKNGDEVAYVATVYRGTVTAGQLRVDGDEVTAVQWFARDELPTIPLTNFAKGLFGTSTGSDSDIVCDGNGNTADMHEDDASEPRVLAGRYELGSLLGHGGMGTVRDATDRRLGRPVAVKILRADLAEQPSARRRFETEAHAAARLAHPNVVTVFDSGEDDGIPFLVMERLPGRTLADELAEGQLAISRVEEVAREVLSALAAAHGAGIIHRDIKPGNVLLTEDGHVKVSDFGIAKTVDDLDQTQTAELVATPGYLAPERLAGEAASQRSDLYSVGVLLYEASSGRRPFSGSHAARGDACDRPRAARGADLAAVAAPGQPRRGDRAFDGASPPDDSVPPRTWPPRWRAIPRRRRRCRSMRRVAAGERFRSRCRRVHMRRKRGCCHLHKHRTRARMRSCRSAFSSASASPRCSSRSLLWGSSSTGAARIIRRRR